MTYQAIPPSAVTQVQLAQAIANWTVGTTRYYMVSKSLGNDGNRGYSDTTPDTAYAIKTLARLDEILPREGAGRTVKIFLNGDFDAAAENLDARVRGYRSSIFRSTSTFVDNLADQRTQHYATAQAGPNGDSSWTVAAGATTSVFTVSAGSLTASPALLGKRVRFVTGALAGRCIDINDNTATQITCGGNLSGAPANGDTFMIEEPGTLVRSVLVTGAEAYASDGSDGNGLTISGLKITTTSAMTWRAMGGMFVASFLDTPNSHIQFGNPGGQLTVSNSYFETDGTPITCGGIRSAGTVAASPGVNTCPIVTYTNTYVTGRASSFVALLRLSSLMASSYTVGATFQACGSVPADVSLGHQGSSFQRRWRNVTAAISVTNACVRIRGVDSTLNISVVNTGGGFVTIDDATGTTTSAQGIDVSTSRGTTILLGTVVANTIVGTTTDNDIKLPGSVFTNHAGLTRTPFVDEFRNVILGSGAGAADQAYRVTNKTGGAVAVGEVVRTNATTKQIVSAQADTAANAGGLAAQAGLAVCVTPAANNAECYVVESGMIWVQFDGAVTLGAIAYLSPGTARNATTTVPAAAGTNQKRRLGTPFETGGTNMARVTLHPENYSILADGAA